MVAQAGRRALLVAEDGARVGGVEPGARRTLERRLEQVREHRQVVDTEHEPPQV